MLKIPYHWHREGDVDADWRDLTFCLIQLLYVPRIIGSNISYLIFNLSFFKQMINLFTNSNLKRSYIIKILTPNYYKKTITIDQLLSV